MVAVLFAERAGVVEQCLEAVARQSPAVSACLCIRSLVLPSFFAGRLLVSLGQTDVRRMAARAFDHVRHRLSFAWAR